MSDTKITGPYALAALCNARAGIPVFPIAEGTKEPLTAHGFKDATTNQDVVRAWWRRWPGANLGMPTGAATSDILDIDNHGEAGNGFAGFRRIRDAGLAAGAHRLVRTPRGGLHLYFRPSGVRNHQLRRHHIDTRGDGGYVLIPPSDVGGNPYEILEDRPQAQGVLDWAGIKALLDPPRPVTSLSRFGCGRPVGSSDALVIWLAGVGEGSRNNALFWACCRMVEGGANSLNELEVLVDTAIANGLPADEATGTAKSALRHYTGAVA